MAVLQQVQITPSHTPSLEDFNSAIALLPEESDDAKLYTDIMKSISLGLLSPNKTQMEAIKLMFYKKVPEAPKDFNVNNKVSVEFTIKEFLNNNQSNQVLALEKARDISIKENAITETLELA